MSNPDDSWLLDLELRATELENALFAWKEGLQSGISPRADPGDPSEPSPREVWDFVHQDLIPEIDSALNAYRSGASQQEMFTWQVGPSTVNVSIIANANGVLIDGSMPWFMRKLYNHYTHLGYRVETLEPTELRISR